MIKLKGRSLSISGKELSEYMATTGMAVDDSSLAYYVSNAGVVDYRTLSDDALTEIVRHGMKMEIAAVTE